jgi:hypothetical protein
MTESPHQGFLRNHAENVRIMRAAAIRARQRGDNVLAERIDEIAQRWDEIGEVAEQQEVRDG